MTTARSIFRWLRGASICLCVAGSVFSCGGGEDAPTEPPPEEGRDIAAVEVSPSDAQADAIGESVHFEATALDASGNPVSDASVSWSSSNADVATVAQDGTATARGEGEATISARTEGVVGRSTLAVDQMPAEVTVTPSTVTLDPGETKQLRADVRDGNGHPVSGPGIHWSSSDTTVVTVDSTGLASARKEGEAKVTAAAEGVEGFAELVVDGPPSVELSVRLDFDNSARRDSLSVAEGESVILEWTAAGDPTECRASGAWSGARSTSGGAEHSEPLTNVGSLTFTLECENSAGSARASVNLEVKDDETFHVRSDRVDDFVGEQVHLFYVVTRDGEDREWDLDGTLADSLEFAQDWFRSETDGREVVIDTYRGTPEITFLRLPFTDAEATAFERVFVEIWKELRNRGFRSEGPSEKKYLAYYDGPLGKRDGGGGARDPYGLVMFSGGGHALTVLHELFHTLGAVDEDAPNQCDVSHVCDSARDLMRGPSVSGIAFPKILDVGRDDYYAEELPDDLTNLYSSPFFTQPR